MTSSFDFDNVIIPSQPPIEDSDEDGSDDVRDDSSNDDDESFMLAVYMTREQFNRYVTYDNYSKNLINIGLYW